MFHNVLSIIVSVYIAIVSRFFSSQCTHLAAWLTQEQSPGGRVAEEKVTVSSSALVTGRRF